jgi:hypothetical protein
MKVAGKITAEQMNYDAKRIRAIRDAGQGFTATTCGNCEATANVPTGLPGWWCPCGHWNVCDWSGNHQKPHKSPTYGPPAARITKALK